MPLEYVDDLTPARWIAERLHPFAQDAGAIVPPGFEAYARIFHPAIRHVGDVGLAVTWRDIAAANLRAYHPEMQFGALVALVGTPTAPRSQAGLFDDWPRTGTLRLEDARALLDVLAQHTTSPARCWFAAWEGFGSLEDGSMVMQTIDGGKTVHPPPQLYRERPKQPTFELPGRGYYLAKGPLTAALETVYGMKSSYQSASLWWPDDRAWCVATEIDLDSTYVGGSKECIAAVLNSPDLEALRAHLSDGISYASDPINPTPSG